MKDNSDIIKENFYEWIKNFGEEKLLGELNKGSPKIISRILQELNSKFIQLNLMDDKKIPILITVMMHYFLTILLIPSQRKISHNESEIDIIIPNLRKLKDDPKHALIIDIPVNQTQDHLEKRLRDLQRIHPIKENIWFLLNERMNLNCKMFSVEDKSFYDVIEEIKKFIKTHNSNQLKILKN